MLQYSTKWVREPKNWWLWEAFRNQWTKIGSTLWNNMVELVDMPGRSIILSIFRLWSCRLKRVGEGFRVLFFDPTEGILKISFGDFFVWEVTHSRKNYPHAHGPLRELLIHLLACMLLVNLLVVYWCRKFQQSVFANLTRWYLRVDFFEAMESRVGV